MKKIALLALLAVTMFTGRALAQDPGCSCPQCISALAQAEQQVQKVAEDQAALQREAKEAELLGQWTRLATARERLAQLNSEVARLESEVARLAGEFQTSTEPTPAKQVVAPVRATAPVLPQCGSGCASELRSTFQTNAAPAAKEGCGSCDGAAPVQVKKDEGCGSCDAAPAQVKKADEGCGSCGGCSEGAAVQVKKADEGCGSCGGCSEGAAVQVKKDEGCSGCTSCSGAAAQVKKADEGCSSCSAGCSGCGEAAAVQVKKDEGCSGCSSCGSAPAAAQMVKAFDTRGVAQEGCAFSAVDAMSCCELDHALAMARARVARTESAVVVASVRVRALKTDVALGKLGLRADPVTQQVKALGAPKAACTGACQTGSCSDCGGCTEAAPAQVKAEGSCDGCSGCSGACPAAPAAEVKKEGGCSGCGSCGDAAATQVKKDEGSCGGCASGCSCAPKS